MNMFEYGMFEGKWWVWFLDREPYEQNGPFLTEEEARARAEQCSKELGLEFRRGADRD
jgi:hypothetical protein